METVQFVIGLVELKHQADAFNPSDVLWILFTDKVINDVGGKWHCVSLLVSCLPVKCLSLYKDWTFVITRVQYYQISRYPFIFFEIHDHSWLQISPLYFLAPIWFRDITPVFASVAAVLLSFDFTAIFFKVSLITFSVFLDVFHHGYNHHHKERWEDYWNTVSGWCFWNDLQNRNN